MERGFNESCDNEINELQLLMNGTYFAIFLATVSLPVAYLVTVAFWIEEEWRKVEGHDGEA